ncbi:MAG: hypothetical protein WC050_01460 [Candidatus Paceibacterota bacterium]
MKPFDTRYLPLVALVVIIIAIIAAGLSVLRAPRTVSGTIDPLVKTYASQDYGIIFLYPKTYFVVERDATSSAGVTHIVTLFEDTPTARAIVNGTMEGTEPPPSITVHIYPNTKGVSTASWARTARESNFDLGDKTFINTTLGGEPALLYRWSGLYEGITIARARPKRIYAVSVMYLSKEDPIMTAFGVVASSTTFTK